MGNYHRKSNRSPSAGRVLLVPVLGTILLILAIIVGLMSRGRTVPEVPTEPTLAPNPYTPADFIRQGDYLTLANGTARLGVDVSEHQKEIDWAQVADAGMEFAFVRLGYRGYTQGGMFTDAYAAQNIAGAREAGLKVGAYFYSQAVSVAEAQEEAAFCIDFLKDHSIDLPVVFDWEYVSGEARTAGVDKQTLTEAAKAFCEAMEAAGYQAMIYFNPHIASDYLDLFALDEYGFWLSLYTETMTYPNKVSFWQYTERGSVPGITGNADINIWFPD